MKKVIASILVTILASAGYVFIDKSIEDRVSNLEVSCSSLQAEVDKYHPQNPTDPTNPTSPTEPITVPTTLGPWSDYPLPASGWCGDYVSWNLDEDGNLTIDGHGKMYDSPLQWDKYKYQIKTVTIGDSVQSIGNNVFEDCVYLTSAYLGQNIETIGTFAFSRCNRLTEINMPQALKSIGMYAFQCSQIKSLSFFNLLKTIGQGAFQDCTELETIHLGNRLEDIGFKCFSGCTSLKEIDIPAGIKYLNAYAFESCTALSSVIIRGENITRIQTCAFKDCSTLRSVILPPSINQVENMAFAGCRSITDVYYAGTESAWNTILIEENNALLTDATIHYNYVLE